MEKQAKANSRILSGGILLMLIGTLVCACGRVKAPDVSDERAEENMAAAENAAVENAPGQNSTAEDIIYKEPPLMELQGVSEEMDSAVLRAYGYTWTYLETDETAVGMNADAPDILMENARWETLTLPDDISTSSYMLLVAKLPDELGITAWNIADTGKKREECAPIETCRYSRAEMEADGFCLSLKPGRIYEIYMKWDEEKLMENRFRGIAYYAVRTDGESLGESLTGKGNAKGDGILISIDDSYNMTAIRKEDGEKIQSDSDSDTSAFLDVLIKYTNLDIERDENQYMDDSVTYSLQIFDLEGQLVQTIEYKSIQHYLCIDGVRCRDKKAGTTRELFLAIDNLFSEDFPTASFGAADDGEADVIEEVTMEAAYATPKGIHLVFTNHTDREYVFGDDYELWAWRDGKWRKADYIIDNYAFNAIGYMLPADSQADWDAKWTYFHGILPNGQYRITKSISEENAGKERANYRLAAEFTVSTGM